MLRLRRMLFLSGYFGTLDPIDEPRPVRSRCLHPGQQQGRRWPSSSSSRVLRTRRFRVISCFASSTQQMNSLRAKGVMSIQAASAVELAISASRRSAGSSCTTPPGTRLLVTEESRSASGRRRSRESIRRVLRLRVLLLTGVGARATSPRRGPWRRRRASPRGSRGERRPPARPRPIGWRTGTSGRHP